MFHPSQCEAGLVAIAMLLHGGHAFTPPTPMESLARVQTTKPLTAVEEQIRMTKHPRGTDYAKQGYLEYLPPSYGAAKSPLLIAFHGRGEGGVGSAETLEKLNVNGVPELIKHGKWNQEARPFVVLAPQHDGDSCPTGKEIADFIHFAKSTYKIDGQRVYLTGLSCGARGVNDYLANYGSKGIAAVVLVSGDLSPAWAEQGCALVEHTPLWVIHGVDDTAVPITGDRAVKKHVTEDCSNIREIKFTFYPHTGHDAWTRAYASAHHDVFSWMLNWKSEPVRSAHVGQ